VTRTRTRWAAAPALLLALCACSAAAALTAEDAARIGREASVPGLRALVAERNQGLLFRATQSWNFGTSRVLSEPLEALIVEHYADPVAQRPLVTLLAKSLDNHERYPKYRGRRLFDLLYADLKAGKETHHYALRIIATDQPVDRELTALLPVLDPAAANELVMFLGKRKYAPALPALQALQARIPLDRDVNGMLGRVNWAYLQIGTPEALQALYARLATLGGSKDARAGYEVAGVLTYVEQQPPGSPPDYAELRAALPAEIPANAWDALVRLIEKRKEKRGIPDLQRAIQQSPRPDYPLEVLLAVGGPDDWRAARVPPDRPAMQKKLDAALADPAQVIARRDERERQEAVYRAQAEFGREKSRITALRATEPKRYVAEMRAFLDRQTAANYAELWREYLALAGFMRFELRQPDEAIATYQRAEQLMQAQPINLAAVSIADTYRFDKRDAARAVQHYRRAIAGLPAGRAGQEAMLAAGIKQWLEHEIAYVERGKRFSGAISRADMGSAQLWLMLGALQGPSESPADPRSLSRLPPSQLQLGRGLPLVLELEPREMLAFFDKHDPTGYLTAGILGAASIRNPSPYVKAAAETFYRERGIQGGPFAKPDPRYASPEKTWALFLAAGRKGDAAGMLDCLTPEMQGRFQDLFKRMSRDDLRKMSESFTGFALTATYGEFSEAMVVRKQGDRNLGGAVTFVNDGGTWKIAEM
jgi:tetratricopeptide (TPR) repeat protein